MIRRALLVIVFAVLAAACEPLPQPVTSGYGVGALHTETVSGQLDSRWFLRNVPDAHGTAAIELVYCPIVPHAETVCRTAVVWSRGHSALVDAAAGH